METLNTEVADLAIGLLHTDQFPSTLLFSYSCRQAERTLSLLKASLSSQHRELPETRFLRAGGVCPGHSSGDRVSARRLLAESRPFTGGVEPGGAQGDATANSQLRSAFSTAFILPRKLPAAQVILGVYLTQSLGGHSGFLASGKVKGSLELARSAFNFLRWFTGKVCHSFKHSNSSVISHVLEENLKL